MKILHIIDGLTMGGAENLLIGLAGEQQARGNDVTVAPLVCLAHTPVRDKMEAKGVMIHPLKARGAVYNPFFVLRIMGLIMGFDIVHVHLFPALYWAGFAKMLTGTKIPFVFTEHSTTNKRRGNKFLHAMDRLVYQHGYRMVVACSDKAQETFAASFPTIDHLCVINNGVDTSANAEAKPYSKQELLGLPEDCFLLTMVARFMSMKRQGTIVEALAQLPTAIHAVFVGGEEKDEGLIRVKELARDLGVAERVHFLYIRKDVPRILKTSDVVLMASDYEGLSLSSIEGMAAGKPFVASDVNGLREVVGGAGILFENRNPEALAKAILRLYEDKSYYDAVADRCASRAKEYDQGKMVDAYMDLYQSLCGR